MSSRYSRDSSLKDSMDNSRRHQFLGQRSKTMVEETSTSRYKDKDSPGLGRRYGSARYHRTTVDLPIRASSTVSSYQPRSSVEPSSPRSKYRTAATTSDITEQPFTFSRAHSFDHTKYSSSKKAPVYHDFETYQTEAAKSKKYTSGLRSPPSLSRSSTAYTPKYTSTDKWSSISTSPLHHRKDSNDESSSRSNSFSSRGSSGSTSRKSSTGSVGRDKMLYVGSYSGRGSPEVSTAQDISRLSQKITKTFDKGSRRSSDTSVPTQGSRSPFLRSYSLRSDYTSRYVQHKVRERTSSSPAKTMIHKQSSLPEEKSIVTQQEEERSRKGSWLQKQSPDSPERGSFSKMFGRQRSGSSSPSEASSKFSLTGKLSSSNESNTDPSGGLFKKKFSVPSKYFSSKETMSRESSEGSSEILDALGTGKTKKKYSLPTKLNLMRRRSSSIEGSKSEPASPDRYLERFRGRSSSVDMDSEKEPLKGSVMRRFKFWDKKERRSPRSRSISPEGRQSARSPEETPDTKPIEKPSNVEIKENKDNQTSTAAKSLDMASTPSEATAITVVSKKVEIDDSQATRKLSREERRARYKRAQNTAYSKSMDAAIGRTPESSESTTSTNVESEMQPSDKLRERRRLRRLEREKAFASESSASGDTVRQSRQKLKLSVSTEDSGISKQRSQTICSSAHQDIIESILKEQPHLSRDTVRPPSVKEMLKRFICEDDTSKTILDSRRRKEEGRPHTICGGSLSPDEMRKFDDINFSLARQYSPDTVKTVKQADNDVIPSSSDVVGQDTSNTLETQNQNNNKDIKIDKAATAAVGPSKTEKIIRRFSFKSEEETPHRSLFSRRRHSPDQEEKEKKKEIEREKAKGLEKKEKRLKEKEEKERKEKEKHKEKEEKAKKEKEEKAKKEKEEKAKKEKEEKLRKEKEEKERKEKEEKARKEKEGKLKKEKEEKAKKERDKHKVEKEKAKEEEKEKKEKKEHDHKEKLKDKEKRQQEKKDRKERKHKLMEEQKEKQRQLMEEIKMKSADKIEENEITEVDGIGKHRVEGELPREGSVSALLNLFSQAEQMEKPRYPLRIQKVRPRTLAAGIAPEIIKTAREMMERREKFDAAHQTQDDSNINTRPDSLIEEPDRLVSIGDTNRLADKNEEDRKKELRRLHKAKKARKSSTLRPFGMTKTKSESNLDQPFELIHVDIDIDEQTESQEQKKSKIIELTPVAKQTIPAVQIPVIQKPSQTKQAKKTALDEGLEDFFGETKTNEEKTEVSAVKVDITTEDLDVISSQTTQYLHSVGEDKMHLKPKRRHATKSNPVKALKERQDVRTDTEAPRTPRIEKKPVTSDHAVIRRKKKKYKDPENLWRRHTLDLAASAIAGLASTEDFTKVTLRKTGGPEKAKEQDDYRGTQPIMMLHIKGRRNMQTRLIEPCQKSLNSGDCFVLVTKEDLFAWVGKDANAIERAKVTEIASRIFTKRELDCKARDITFIEEREKDPEKLKGNKKFWNVLSGDPSDEIRAADSMPIDEEFEKGMTKTNMVYKVHWTEPPSLIPVESMCGRLPQVSILDTKEVLVFDFGSELYVWNGQHSLSGQRKTVFALGKQLFESPFEPNGIYNPLYPYGKGQEPLPNNDDNKTSPARPPWALFARLHEKAETILFREKFLDWPDPTKIIKMKGHPSSGELIIKKHIPVELKPCDPKVMLSNPEPTKGESFEGVNVGRGHGVPTRWTGDYYKEGNLCSTVGLTVWHINEYRHYELPPANVGHFHSGEGYVIRWAYYVMNDRIAKDRKSRCRSTIAGRVRTAYYFWQGNDCTVNEKGAAAVMAVELDEERGPQVRVVQGKEPPSFLNHFKGGMIIHSGNTSKCWFDVDAKTHVSENIERLSDTSIIRLYCLRNEESGEGCLVQVKAACTSLRSRGCFILLLCREEEMYVWYGCKATEGCRRNVLAAAKLMQEKKPLECNIENTLSISLIEVEESKEPDEFFKALGGKKYYCSLIKDPSPQQFTPRLFELTSATGKFLSNEILNPSRVDGKVDMFPFLQDDVYGIPQPALFLLDLHYEVYVWEGWIPENDLDSLTGTGRQRWDTDRRLAMETAIKYAEEAGKRISHRVFVVYAGLEPMSFKVAFPMWHDKPYITSIQKETGKQPGTRHMVAELLNQFTKETYSLEELQQTPPPQGVDPSKLETYLNKEDFSNIFKMNAEEFEKLPGWKQQNLKKAVGLF